MKMKVLCGAAIAALTLMSGVVVAQSIQPGYALINRSSAGSSTEYSVSLVMRAEYEDDIKYFSYNSEYHYASENTDPVEYRLDFVNGNSNQFSIFNGSKYLDISTSSHVFTESDSPVYWGHDVKGIGRTVNKTTKYLYYNHDYTRAAPYIDKTKQDGTLTNGYASIFFYTEEQLISWKGHCSGSFAEACLTTLINGDFIPSDGETPINPEEPPISGIKESVDFTTQGYNNSQAITSYSGTNFTVTFSKGTGSNAPVYYTKGTAIRCYSGNTITVRGNNLVRIVIAFGNSDGSNIITTDVGTYANGIWTGSANDVVFTIGGTSGNRRFAGITVTSD